MLLDREPRLTQHSYYEASVTRPPALPALAGRVQADVCVIGAGLVGLSAALELRARGYSVVLLEAQVAGWGASGRNGGQLIAGFASEDAIEAQFNAADAARAWNVTIDALDLVRERIATHGIECDQVDGYMTLATSARKARELAARTEQVERLYGYQVESLPAGEVGAAIASKRFYGGVRDRRSGHLHPLKYCLGMAAAACKAGVQLFEHSPVTSVERGARPLVRTALGEVACEFVVMAGNVYLNEYGKRVAPDLGRRIMPVGTYIVATEPMDKARADALISGRNAVCDTNFILDYFRTTADHRMLFGGRVSYSSYTPPKLVASMRQRMLAVFPQLADLDVPHSWGGFVDITMNRGPDFGRVGTNIYYLQGFSGHGLALSGMAGKLAAEAIDGQATTFDLMARLRHMPFPGGALLRTPALVLGMLYYQIRDLL
jgi:gamma-glutamylputrescine oxidase